MHESKLIQHGLFMNWNFTCGSKMEERIITCILGFNKIHIHFELEIVAIE